MSESGEYTHEQTPASDVWSLGLVLFFLCFSALPYEHSHDVDALRAEIVRIWQCVPARGGGGALTTPASRAC